MDEQVEDRLHYEGIDKEVDIPESKSTSGSSYDRPNHDVVRREIQEAPTEHEKDGLIGLLEDRFEKVMLDLFQEARKRAKNNVYTPIYEVTGQAPFKVFSPG